MWEEDPNLVDAVRDVIGQLFSEDATLSPTKILATFKEHGLMVDFVRPEHDRTLIHRGALTLYPAAKIAYWKDYNVNLTMMEYRVIDFLTSPMGERRSYREIYDVCRGKGFIAGGVQGFTTNVRSTFKRVRNKFKARDAKFDCIKCISGFGYIWMEW